MTEEQPNPFQLPGDNDLFQYKKELEKEKLQRHKDELTKSIFEKTSIKRTSDRISSVKLGKSSDLRDLKREEEDYLKEEQQKEEAVIDGSNKTGLSRSETLLQPIHIRRAEKNKFSVKKANDRKWAATTSQGRRIERESLNEYIKKKREMFLIQYSLDVKRNEIAKLDELAVVEEKKLEKAEKFLEQDAKILDECLKENDNSSVQANKIAEEEARKKQEKVQEIKKLQARVLQLKSEISKMEDTLKEYRIYQKFLFDIAPDDWKKVKVKEIDQLKKTQQIPVKREEKKKKIKDNDEENDEDLLADDLDGELYFKSPEQLLNLFTELEKQNLSLIQNSQDTEEQLDDLKGEMKNKSDSDKLEIERLSAQIQNLEVSLISEENRAKELQIRSKLFSFGEFQEEDQEKTLKELNLKVGEIYQRSIGTNEANISTLQMLTNIEMKLENLFQQIELLDKKDVEKAEKQKDKERRLRQREQKLKEQEQYQEERAQRALARAKEPPKKHMGRRIMARSRPPNVKKKETKFTDEQLREEEQLKYFFTP
ncbi:hypothetical protein SNEBB_007315 [Seison nebaliae]|nr:hypothetical protein SNEBB_007315 [Seison nebaliae]